MMVEKILAYENRELSEKAAFVLVADNADQAGNFEKDADELASRLLAGRETTRIYLSQLGTSAAREAIVESADKGAIAAFSPSGLSLNGPAHRYHQAVLQQLLSDHTRLGDAVLAAQKQYADTGAFPELLSIYHLFGDPALTLR